MGLETHSKAAKYWHKRALEMQIQFTLQQIKDTKINQESLLSVHPHPADPERNLSTRSLPAALPLAPTKRVSLLFLFFYSFTFETSWYKDLASRVALF